MKIYEKLTESKTLYQGKILDLRLDSVQLQNGKISTREVVKHPGAVCIAALTPKKELVFVKQYRHACAKVLLELPAGKLEKGENSLECAKRELQEETGIIGKDFTELGYIYVTPGYSDEIIHLYACKIDSITSQSPDEDEFLEITNIKLDKAIDMALNDEIHDAKTQICILKASNLVLSGKLSFD